MRQTEYLTLEEAAKLIGVAPDELWTFTLESDKPGHEVLDGALVYRKAEVERLNW